MLIVAGDHSRAPPQRRLIQGFCRSFSSALLGGVIPVGLQRASLFTRGPDPAGRWLQLCGAVKGREPLFQGRGPQFLLPSQGLFAGRPVRRRSTGGQS